MDSVKRFIHAVPLSVLLLLFFFSVYTFTIYGRLRYGDETERYLQAQSLVERQSFAIRLVPAHSALGADGKTYYSQFELGYGLLLIPFYAAGRLISMFSTYPDLDAVPVLFVHFVNPILTALTCTIFFQLNRLLGVSTKTALGVTMMYGLATLAWPYSRGLYREATQALTLLFAVYALELVRRTGAARYIFLAGLSFGYLVFTKISNLVMLPLFLGYLVLSTNRQSSNVSQSDIIRRWMSLGLFLFPIFVFLIIQGIVNFLKFGDFFDIGAPNYRDPFPYFSLLTLPSGVGGLLLSPTKGLIGYAPPVILFLPSWVNWFRKDKLAGFVLSLVLTNILYYGAYYAWEGGTYWGTRYLVVIVPLLILPLGLLIDKIGGGKRILLLAFAIAIFLVGLIVQVGGVLVGDRDYLDITGQWIQILGAWDFLRHGAIDSLWVHWSPQTESLLIHPYGWALIGFAIVFALWIVTRVFVKSDVIVSARYGIITLACTWSILLAILIAQVVMVIPHVQSMQGDTRFAAAERFFSEQRYCEAEKLYLASLSFGTPFARQAQARLLEIRPLLPGQQIDLGALDANVEAPEVLDIAYDSHNVLSETESLRISSATDGQVRGTIMTEFISLEPGTRYELSGWYRSQGILGDGAAIIGWYEDNGRWRFSRSMDIISFTGTGGWQPLRVVITTLPTTKRGMIKASLWNTSGTFWLEGIRLNRVNEQLPVRPLCGR